MSESNQPDQTLYCKNLPDKLKTATSKKSLYMLFSEFGKILEIRVSRAQSLRGQAWIVFSDVTAATEAMRRRQGFNFYGKPMVSKLCSFQKPLKSLCVTRMQKCLNECIWKHNFFAYSLELLLFYIFPFLYVYPSKLNTLRVSQTSSQEKRVHLWHDLRRRRKWKKLVRRGR